MKHETKDMWTGMVTDNIEKKRNINSGLSIFEEKESWTCKKNMLNVYDQPDSWEIGFVVLVCSYARDRVCYVVMSSKSKTFFELFQPWYK